MAADLPAPTPSDPLRGGHEYPQVPAATATLGMWLFLIALFMLFASAMLAYIFIRLAGSRSPSRGFIHLPRLLWLSTVLVIGVSFALARSLRYLRIERQADFRRWITIALVLGAGFLIVQAPAMALLLAEHRTQAPTTGVFLYGLVFVLVLLHALHVVGGMVALVRVAVRGRHGVYDHEHYLPVRHTAMYWHFLDAIWITMFVTFLATA